MFGLLWEVGVVFSPKFIWYVLVGSLAESCDQGGERVSFEALVPSIQHSTSTTDFFFTSDEVSGSDIQ